MKHRGEIMRDVNTGLPVQVWEPILSVDDWHQLRAQVASPHNPRGVRQPVRPRAARLLSGLLRCDAPGCGRPLYATHRKLPNGEKQPFYACSAKRNGHDCPGTTINAEPIEKHVGTTFLAGFGRLPVVQVVTIAVDDGRRADIEAAITEMARQMTERGADVAALSTRLVALHAERDGLPAKAPTEVRRVPTGKTFRETWEAESQTTDGRRALLASAVEAVRVRPGVKGRKGFDESRVSIDLREGEHDPDTDG